MVIGLAPVEVINIAKFIKTEISIAEVGIAVNRLKSAENERLAHPVEI